MGSGAAVGGGRFEHWRVVLAEPAAMSAFCNFCDRLATGDLPAAAADALALSRLTPLHKPGGGVRPIAAPNIIRRLVGRALVAPRKEELATALGRQQFAIGTKAGAELLAHTVRALTEANPDLVLTALDAKNAYGTVRRESCLAELEAAAPDLLPFANLFCRRRSQYYFWDNRGSCHRLCSADGVDQGDPLAPLLFACGARPALRELEEALRGAASAQGLRATDVHVLAYLDDVIVLTPPELAGAVETAAQAALGALGLELQPQKTQVWSAQAPCPPGLEARWRRDGLTLLGVPLGEPLPPGNMPDESDGRRLDLGGAGYAAARCAETAERAAALLRKLAQLPALASPHLPAAQAAGLLLRLCGAGKLTHQLRSSPLADSRAAAAAYDEAVLEAYRELARLDPLQAGQQAQCRLPLRLGGRGFRSQAELAPAAWAAGARERTGLAELADLETSTLPLAAACRGALTALLPDEEERRRQLPPWELLAQEPRQKLQKALTQRLDKKNHEALLSALGAEERALLRSCGGAHAAGWQLANGGPRQKLEDPEYCATARALLGQDAAPAGARCGNRYKTGPRTGQLCGQALCPKARHAYRCSCGGGPKARSRDVEDVWGRIYQECGFRTDRQVPVPAWDRWRWRCAAPACAARGTADAPPPGPCGRCGAALQLEREEAFLDLEAQRGDVPRLYADVTVRYSVPGEARALAAAADGDGAVNADAEGDKRRRYAPHRAPWPMLPLALETGGRHGLQALRHLRWLARDQAQALGDGPAAAAAASALARRWGAELSVALHKATARQLRAAVGGGAAAEAAGRLAAELAG